MLKRACFAVFAVTSLCLALPLQAAEFEEIASEDLWISGQTEVAAALSFYRPDLISAADGALFLHGSPAVTLLEGRRFPISGDLGRMGRSPVADLPLAFVSAVDVSKEARSLRHGSDSSVGTIDMRLKRFDYGGEVGVFYGRSEGRYSREDMSAYIIGGIGNEKFNLTVGASYTETTVRGPDRR